MERRGDHGLETNAPPQEVKWASRCYVTSGMLCNQRLASLLKVTAPEKRAFLTRETIGLVRCHFPASDHDARGRLRSSPDVFRISKSSPRAGAAAFTRPR